MALQFLDTEGITVFTEYLKKYVEDADAESIKSVALSDDETSILFYRTATPTEETQPSYSIEIPECDLSDYMELVTSAVPGNIAVLDAAGQVVDSDTAISDLATAEYVGKIPEGYEATTVTEYAKELADEVAENGYDDTEIKEQLAVVEAAIETLNGDEDAEGSVAYTVKAAVEAEGVKLEEALDEKADKATTLAGYGIEDAYTKDETDAAIAAAASEYDHLEREIVEELPDVAEADTNTIYMVPREEGEETVYDEYMVIDGSWEKIGTTGVDLDDYATLEYVAEAIESASVNYATAEQGAKADTAVQSVSTGEEAGTISVDGESVTVAGLGSAAYEDITPISTEFIASLFE